MAIVEVPVFTGVHLRPWIDWMEQYFARYDDFTDLQKQAMAYGFIEGDALLWFHRRQSLKVFETWEELRDELLMKYGDDGDPERNSLLAEQDRLMRRLRANATIQKEKKLTVTETIREDESKPKEEWIRDKAANLETKSLGAGELIETDTSIHEIESAKQSLEKKSIAEKNSRTAKVNCDDERFQKVTSIKKYCSAHKVFDEMSPQQTRLETIKKMKVSKYCGLNAKGKIRKRRFQTWIGCNPWRRVEREKEIQQVAESVNGLAQIMKGLSALVIDQGLTVDRIDYNIQNVTSTVEDGLKQLHKAERTHRHGGMVMCVFCACHPLFHHVATLNNIRKYSCNRNNFSLTENLTFMDHHHPRLDQLINIRKIITARPVNWE